MTDYKDDNEYKVLARKYRPKTFGDLIGQETLVQILTNAISINRIAHAYLLTGIRGVGKTTTARLIAMSLNCESRSVESCEPCGKCKACISIKEDNNIDVIEMDAASKTGVDDIREIIENVKYKPVSSNYKIFVIDEVHMLSKNAFNALLKTLEEPPPHIKFIFATTEIKKIPLTIISRCQRFDLLRIENSELTNHINTIANKENIRIEQDAVSLIVRAADGSVRDALSLLDQSIANEKDNIKAESVIRMLALADRGNIFDLMEAIFKGDVSTSLQIYNTIYKSGADVLMIFDEMLKVTHFLTQIKISPDLKEDINIPELERKVGSSIADQISIASLGLVWQVLFKGFRELQYGYNLFQHGEMIIIRLIYLYNGPSPDDLLNKIKNEDKKENFENKEALNSSENEDLINKNHISNDIKEQKYINLKKINKKNSIEIKSFRNFVDLFYQKKEALIHTNLYNNVKLISFKEGELVINDKLLKDTHFPRTIAKLISKWTGRIWKISSSDSNIGSTLYEEDILKQKKEIEVMKNDKQIKELLKKFPDVKIHSITDIIKTSDDLIDNDQKNKIKEK